jgi:trimeric autotransporter adhesin
MNIVRIPRLLKNSTLLLAALGSSLLLTACGGDSNKSASSSSSSSSTSSHAFSSTPVTPPLSGTWPDVKVSASGTKTLKFDWTAAPGATFYKLLKKADSNSTYVQIGPDFNGTTVSDSVSVHLTDWVNSRYKVQACNDTGCQDSTVVVADSAMNTAITYMKASNTDVNDWFGWSIAISGDGKTLAVGAPAEASNAKGANGDQTSNTSPTSGAVYVFAKVNGNWQQEAFLKASNTEQPSDGITQSLPNSRFGYQVALSTDGNTLAVSAINEDSRSMGVNCEPNYITSSSSASNSAGYLVYRSNIDVGAVYVFNRTNTQWAQTAYIKPLFPASNLTFGYSLALSGDGKTLAVGTAVESLEVSGLVSLEENSSSSVAFVCFNFSSSSSTSSSSSSTSSSSSSSSSTTNSSNSSSLAGGPNSGAVYIYRLKDTGWKEDAYVKASDAGAQDYFGESIALSQDGNLMAVGAPGEDSKDTSANNDTVTVENISAYLDTGAVYIFQKTNQIWLQQAKVKPSKNEWLQAFGTSVALSADGNTLAVGAPGDWSKSQGVNSDSSNYTLEALVAYNGGYYIHPKQGSSYSTGAAYIFIKSNAAWAQQAYIKPNVSHPGFQFGSTVSLSGNGNVLAVGSWIESSLATGINGDQLDISSVNSGAAYAFTRTSTTWAQQSYIKAPNSNALDRFGRALKLDDSGENLAVGAYREGSKAVGINGDKTDNSAAGAGAIYIY